MSSRSDGLCGFCRSELPTTSRLEERKTRRDIRYCKQQCRQTAFRLRRRRATAVADDVPRRFAYADPPYPGLARRYYRNEPTFAGEVDHRELVASLGAGGYAGWALSTSSSALREVWALCPEARLCPWVKPIAPSPKTYGPHRRWEALLVVGGRQRRNAGRDFLIAQPARGGGTLTGRKPISFCAFLFDMLGMIPGDELVDVFPGTGIVGRAWADLSSRSSPTRVARSTRLSSTSDGSGAKGH